MMIGRCQGTGMAKIMVIDEHPGHLDWTLDKCVNIDEYEQVKTNNLFWPNENSIQQCFVSHIVQCCQQYYSNR